MDLVLKCPNCDSDAIYKYGKTSSGKQKYVCQVCGRQFVTKKNRDEFASRPTCPECGKRMHIYMRKSDYIRFRCLDYPACRTFKKVKKIDLSF